ncbi:hypothetical protein J3Q64DRAFT_1726961 [Phycomyces blakesleeanus]|uniref:PIPK domain-containing protein n=1 Tax=Phycomyces blakesleeanus TaxID=4837 RepID=A0ABR3B7M9_PHYBL
MSPATIFQPHTTNSRISPTEPKRPSLHASAFSDSISKPISMPELASEALRLDHSTASLPQSNHFRSTSKNSDKRLSLSLPQRSLSPPPDTDPSASSYATHQRQRQPENGLKVAIPYTPSEFPLVDSPIADPSLSPQSKIISGIRPPSTFSVATPLRHTTPDLGDLDPDEQAALAAEIKARRIARRVSRRIASPEDLYDLEDEERVAIGTRVAEGHPNYQLMYDMLTGIRIAVGRVSAKIKRDLTEEDFRAAHKLVFDVTGTELTPGVKYDFKFKDYAPWVFRNLREQFHIDPADYMMSLTNKYILSELGSPGKSGSFFYYSRDYRFIIKTIHHTEHKFMRKVLGKYYQHVCENPNTLLCRFYGLYRIKLPHGRKIHFVVMGNVFPANKDIHETYDLKGSTFGRLTPEEEISKNPHAVMKDQNWVQRHKTLELGPLKRELLITQLERDVELLKRLKIMDYSLLIGIHDLLRGNREGIRDHRLHIVKPDTRPSDRDSSSRAHKRENKADMVRKALKSVNPVQLSSSELPESPSDERRYCVFYAEEGGFFSTGQNNDPADKIYFVGIIDILTPYNIVKKTEHLWKSLTQDKHAISAVNPLEYGTRFMHFMKKTVTRTESAPN